MTDEEQHKMLDELNRLYFSYVKAVRLAPQPDGVTHLDRLYAASKRQEYYRQELTAYNRQLQACVDAGIDLIDTGTTSEDGYALRRDFDPPVNHWL
jgi:formamidopyrimidine-DNA glycosylase